MRNGELRSGLPAWSAFSREVPRVVMRLGPLAAAEAEADRWRYEFLDAVEGRSRGTP